MTLNPSSTTGGSSLQGTVTLSAPAPAATSVNLSSSSALASVPASLTIAAGASSAGFTIATASVASPASVTISATLNATTQTATLTLNPAPAPAPVDAVSISLAQYDPSKRTLRIEAASTRSTATLQVFVTAGGQLIGTLTNKGGGKYAGEFASATNPQSITVRSSSGGSATRSVVAK